VLLWSIATAACGLTRSFAQLFLARISVGIGEASLAPAAHSLLSDYFTRRQLPRAFAIFQMGQYIGGGGAYAIGGLIFALASTIDPVRLPLFGPLAPWQLTFLIAAAPGPIVALLMFSVREPTRRRAPVEPASGTAEGFSDHWRRNRGFLFCHLGAAAILGLVAHGVVSWAPSFFIRGFGWTPADVGIAYGTMLIVAGGSGTLFAAVLARRWQDAGHRGSTARVALFATVGSVPFAIAFPLSGSPIVAMGCLFVFSFCTGVTSTMLPTVLQLATPPAFRGRMGGLYVVATTAIGAALGPITVAVVTDLVIGDPSRLNESIAIVCGIFGPLAIALSLGAYRYFARIPDDAPQSPIAT
jgi:MFS family permease